MNLVAILLKIVMYLSIIADVADTGLFPNRMRIRIKMTNKREGHLREYDDSVDIPFKCICGRSLNALIGWWHEHDFIYCECGRIWSIACLDNDKDYSSDDSNKI